MIMICILQKKEGTNNNNNKNKNNYNGSSMTYLSYHTLGECYPSLSQSVQS